MHPIVCDHSSDSTTRHLQSDIYIILHNCVARHEEPGLFRHSTLYKRRLSRTNRHAS